MLTGDLVMLTKPLGSAVHRSQLFGSLVRDCRTRTFTRLFVVAWRTQLYYCVASTMLMGRCTPGHAGASVHASGVTG
jgi:hypothetical protein